MTKLLGAPVLNTSVCLSQLLLAIFTETVSRSSVLIRFWIKVTTVINIRDMVYTKIVRVVQAMSCNESGPFASRSSCMSPNPAKTSNGPSCRLL